MNERLKSEFLFLSSPQNPVFMCVLTGCLSVNTEAVCIRGSHRGSKPYSPPPNPLHYCSFHTAQLSPPCDFLSYFNGLKVLPAGSFSMSKLNSGHNHFLLFSAPQIDRVQQVTRRSPVFHKSLDVWNSSWGERVGRCSEEWECGIRGITVTLYYMCI